MKIAFWVLHGEIMSIFCMLVTVVYVGGTPVHQAMFGGESVHIDVLLALVCTNHNRINPNRDVINLRTRSSSYPACLIA